MCSNKLLPPPKEDKEEDEYKLLPVQIDTAFGATDFTYRTRPEGMSSIRAANNYMMSFADETVILPGDVRLIVGFLFDLPVNVRRVMSYDWADRGSMPLWATINSANALQKSYRLALNNTERIRRRNICLELKKIQRYRVLKKCMSRYMERVTDEDIYSTILSFTLATLCLGLTFDDVVQFAMESKMYYAIEEEQSPDAKAQSFMEFLAEEANLMVPQLLNNEYYTIEDAVIEILEQKSWTTQ